MGVTLPLPYHTWKKLKQSVIQEAVGTEIRRMKYIPWIKTDQAIMFITLLHIKEKNSRKLFNDLHFFKTKLHQSSHMRVQQCAGVFSILYFTPGWRPSLQHLFFLWEY